MLKDEAMLEIPYGTRDFLPPEAAEKRALETRLMDLFRRWGYDEIATPVIEYLDTLTIGNGSRIEPHMFKLFDRQNRTLALRHEMTTSIARAVASRMKDATYPLRLSYVGSVYRYEQVQAGRQCEFYQAGVEFLGSDSAASDAEVIALAIESLREAGLKNFQICLGQVEFIRGLMEQYCLPPATQEKIKQCLERHNLVGLQRTLEDTGLPSEGRESLARLPLLHGKRDVLDEARQMAANDCSHRALENLDAICGLLEDYDAAGFIRFDLGVIRDFSYYTGMVFEGYTPGLGFPLCGGGRYDNMLSDFGHDCPATGFGLGIERLMLALNREGAPRSTTAKDVYIAYAPGRLSEAIQEACRRRRLGETAELAPSPQEESAAATCQKSKGCRSLVFLA